MADTIRKRLGEIGVTLEDRPGDGMAGGVRTAHVHIVWGAASSQGRSKHLSALLSNRTRIVTLCFPWSPSPSPRVLGIDPGLLVTGYAVVEGRNGSPHVVEAGVIRTVEGRATVDLAPRLQILYDGIVEVIDQFRPTVMAVEQLYAHYKHPRTASS